jgi:hypothetical protein
MSPVHQGGLERYAPLEHSKAESESESCPMILPSVRAGAAEFPVDLARPFRRFPAARRHCEEGGPGAGSPDSEL